MPSPTFGLSSQKDRDARGTVKFTKAKPAEDGAKRGDLAITVFRYKNHIGIDRTHGLIRTWRATHAARHDGAQLPDLIDKQKPPASRCRRPSQEPTDQGRPAPDRRINLSQFA
jgi:hypothetical protein